MASGYTNVLRLEKPGLGSYLNKWDETLARLAELIDDSIAGITEIVTTGGVTVLSTNNGTTDEARRAVIQVTGALTATAIIDVPDRSKNYLVLNETTGSSQVRIRVIGTSNYLIIPQSRMAHVYAIGDTRIVFGSPVAAADGTIDPSSLPTASQTTRGMVQLATDVEALAGVNATHAMTAKQVADKIAATVTGVTDGNKGDVQVTGSGSTWTVNGATITPAKLSNLAGLSSAQAQNIANAILADATARGSVSAGLNVFGASGASHAKGLVPDPGVAAGTVRFLREDGTWSLASGATLTESAAPPALPKPADLWWDTTTETVNIYIPSVGGWIDVSTASGAAIGTKLIESATAPVSPTVGQVWLDTVNGVFSIFTVTAGWIGI